MKVCPAPTIGQLPCPATLNRAGQANFARAEQGNVCLVKGEKPVHVFLSKSNFFAIRKGLCGP